jgi:UDP-N-acetylglucosamine 4,6-dehydratase/5-epimerase
MMMKQRNWLMKLEGKILITGGSGSLGTAIIERATKEKWDVDFTVVARNESKMQVLQRKYNNVRCEIGDVRDERRLAQLFRGQDLVIHAAAIKIVPVAEANPHEAILTNVIGSYNVCSAAIEAEVPKVIGISSDKACGPTYYGLTKRLMEGLFRQASEMNSFTQFVTCRYGNVLKSANSIVPLFEQQAAAGLPLTITDRGMTRFWLSMKQAINLILLTNAEAQSGQIFVPRAPAMGLQDLAHALYPESKIKVIGIRPGERMNETLIVEEEALHTTLRVLGNRESYFCIHHPKKPESNLAKNYTYTSDDPSHWLTGPELRYLLKES